MRPFLYREKSHCNSKGNNIIVSTAEAGKGLGKVR
jgi:hypothetical protein